ncbi:MAG TPA: serine hydrolase domain-containing protein [Roseiflexaceae bacterium]|nr:serine hydrolase domain-containing protein [Roseiflexaceae bacterium]
MALDSTIDTLTTDAIERRIFPGAVVLVAHGGEMLHYAAYGSTMYGDSGSVTVQRDTIYDIASLTKMFTATAVLRLLDQHMLDLHASVASYLPELQASDVTIFHLLTHTSGLDMRLSVLRHQSRAEILRAVYAAPLLHPPGTVVAYTNVNSLLLGEIVARLHGKPFGHALHDLVLEPLGLHQTRFCPPAEWLPRIAPTERDADWRGGLVHGSVHDESTHALGGVAGHAGLFSTAKDLYAFCQMWLDLVTTDDGRLATADWFLHPETARLAMTNQTPDLQFACGLGWMMDRVNFMGNAPAGTFGHTGFTGPAMLVVPSRQLTVVVLSNRVYPQRCPPPYQHHAVTAAIVNAALEILA